VAHKTAVNIMQTRDEEQLKAAVEQQMQHQQDETCRVFRTAYYSALGDRPYTDHPDLVVAGAKWC